MEVKRRQLRNDINNKIKDGRLFISRSLETITRLKNSKMNFNYIKTQIETINESVNIKEKTIDSLENRLLLLNKGELDKEINSEYKQNKDISIIQKKQRREKFLAKQKDKAEKKKIGREYWQGILGACRKERWDERGVRSSWRYFNKVIDTLPSYMQRNLSQMPNNKGYIWRGIWFLGELRARKGPHVMFEKKKGKILVIHEYTKYEYKRYEKVGKERKVLKQKKALKPKKLIGSSILDWIN
jgi:hypothetical protein